MVNGAGQVVGVTTAATVNFRMAPGGSGFAIPINDALATADQIRARAPSDTVHIGPPTLLGVGVSAGDQGARCPASSSARCCAAGLPRRPVCIDGDVLHHHRRRTAEFGDRADRRFWIGTTPATSSTWPGSTAAGQQRTGKATLGS